MKEFTKHILVTGGAGFIGSHVVRRLLINYPDYRVINFDRLTYAGNLENLKDVDTAPNYVFVKGDITNQQDVNKVFSDYGITDVIHLAAESHVDRSISGPMDFVLANVVGTVQLLNVDVNDLTAKVAELEIVSESLKIEADNQTLTANIASEVLPIDGRPAIIIKSDWCKPPSLSSKSLRPVGTPTIRPYRAKSCMCIDAHQIG